MAAQLSTAGGSAQHRGVLRSLSTAGDSARSAPRTAPLSTADSGRRLRTHALAGPWPRSSGVEGRGGLAGLLNPGTRQRCGSPPHTLDESPERQERAGLPLALLETRRSACHRSFGARAFSLECREGEVDEEVQRSP